jgi:hypothetical protein
VYRVRRDWAAEVRREQNQRENVFKKGKGIRRNINFRSPNAISVGVS